MKLQVLNKFNNRASHRQGTGRRFSKIFRSSRQDNKDPFRGFQTVRRFRVQKMTRVEQIERVINKPLLLQRSVIHNHVEIVLQLLLNEL